MSVQKWYARATRLICHRLLSYSVLLAALCCFPATSTPIFGYDGASSGFVSIQPAKGSGNEGHWTAQSFTLTSQLSISAIEVGLYHTSEFAATVQLVKGTPLPSFDPGFGAQQALATGQFSGPSEPSTYDVFSFDANLTLEAGEYFLIVANTLFNGGNFGWAFGNNQLASTQSYGSVGDLFSCLNTTAGVDCDSTNPSNSSWLPVANELNEFDMEFRLIDAVAAAIPAPGTLWLIVFALVALVCIRKQQQAG